MFHCNRDPRWSGSAPLLHHTKQKLSDATPFAVWQPDWASANVHEMESPNPSEEPKQWDFFIAHVTEDKDEIARPLAERLNSRGLMAWYVDYSLKQSSNLRESIDYGLARSRFGIVIISSHFLEKHWPQEELDDLATREVNGRKVILPVWHGIGFREIHEYSPVLADRAAISTDRGLDYVVQRMLKAAE